MTYVVFFRDGSWEMGVGRWELEDGRWELEDGSWKMGDGNQSAETKKLQVSTPLNYQNLKISLSSQIHRSLIINKLQTTQA